MQESNGSSQPTSIFGPFEPRWAEFPTTAEWELDQESKRPPLEDDDMFEDFPCKSRGGKNNDDHKEDPVGSDEYSDEDSDDFLRLMKGQMVKKGKEPEKKAAGFLDLPFDVRRKVYGYLLESEELIRNVNRDYSYKNYIPALRERDIHHTQILATCRQVNAECRDILFDENIFRVTVWEYLDNCERQGRCIPFMKEIGKSPPMIFQRMRRIELVVKKRDFRDEQLGLAIHNTARALSKLPELKQLSVKVASNVYVPLLTSEINPHHFLGGLTMIRNVQEVTIDGLSPDLTSFLIKKMTTSSLLPRMYFALENFAWVIDCGQTALGRAYFAAGQDDRELFLSSRQTVIETVNDHLSHGANQFIQL